LKKKGTGCNKLHKTEEERTLVHKEHLNIERKGEPYPLLHYAIYSDRAVIVSNMNINCEGLNHGILGGCGWGTQMKELRRREG